MKTTQYFAVLVVVLWLAVTPRLGRGATAEQIDQAIEKGKAYLYSLQKDGHWETAPEFHPTPADLGGNDLNKGNWGGLTAMATHALLAAGENANDPKLKPAVDLLVKWSMRTCPYSLAQRDQVLQMLQHHADVAKVAKADGDYLASAMRSAGEAKGLYHYNPGKGADFDHSVSQYGVLAMWACGQSGFEVPSKYWEITEMAWQHHQNADGGWAYGYNPKDPSSTPSMTAAGVATLFITQDYVHSSEGLTPKGNIVNPAIDRGVKWLGDNFATIGGNLYALYGIERIGVAGGYKYFGAHDWFREGSEVVLHQQAPTGGWGGKWGPIPSTSFALFFLSRGREPVAFNKARYEVLVKGKSEEGHWNQRPRDIARITNWLEKNTERNLNWHVVNLREAPADGLADAPILYLSGDRALNLTADDQAKLRQFVEDGGLILGSPDANSAVFIESFKALAGKLFPSYEMRVLPPDHPIYAHQELSHAADIHRKDMLLGLSNGARELMVLSMLDYGKVWQGNLVTNSDAFRVPGNLYLYAAGRTSFRCGGPGVAHPDPAVKTTTTLKLARLEYSGNADPEPGGWRRFAALLHNQEKINLEIQAVKLGSGMLVQGISAAPAFRLAHLTGTTRITLTAEQRSELKQYVAGGGVLLIDAAGGVAAFADSIDQEMLAIFGNDALQLSTPIPAGDPLYNAAAPLAVSYRHYVREGWRRPHGPNLCGIKFQGRWGVLVSHEDFSNALVGRDVDGVTGYTADAATALLTHLVKTLGTSSAAPTVATKAGATKAGATKASAAATQSAGGKPLLDMLPQIAEAKDYQLALDLDLAKLGRVIKYDVDNRGTIKGELQRLAYLVELSSGTGPVQYVWVSMDAFTQELGKIGVPTMASGASFQMNVTGMNVESNVPGIVTGQGLAGGNIEFWPTNYSAANSANVPNASATKYDFGDQPTGTKEGYGSMQVHNHDAKQTLFAINGWRDGPNADLGLGNGTGKEPDWTFSRNAGTYATKRLRVLVRVK